MRLVLDTVQHSPTVSVEVFVGDHVATSDPEQGPGYDITLLLSTCFVPTASCIIGRVPLQDPS
jgi:hypothetical protein